MDRCKWCDEFKNGAWTKLKEDMKSHPEKYLFEVGELNISNPNDEKANRLGKKYINNFL